MKKVSYLLGTLILGGIIAITSCTKTGSAGANGVNGATGPTGPVIYGTITGNVIMVNQYGAAVTNDYTGGYIRLVNPTTNATIDSVIANSSTGAFSIPNVPTGTYNMLCVYAGYGLNEHENLEINGNAQVDNKLAAIPNFNVTSAADSIRHSSSFVYIYGTIAADANGERTLLVFVGKSSSTSSAPPSYNFTTSVTVFTDSSKYTITIPLATIYSNGFASGNTAYFAIYGAADNYADGAYLNYTYGQTVYTAITPVPYNPLESVVLP